MISQFCENIILTNISEYTEHTSELLWINMETTRLKWSLTLVLINAVLITYTIVSWNNISVNQSVNQVTMVI